MSSTDPTPILRDLLAGRLEPPEAARQLLALAGPAAVGLAHASTALPADDSARLSSIMAAVRWEMAKLLSPGQLPAVPYDSAEYHRFIAAMPSGPADPAEPAG